MLRLGEHGAVADHANRTAIERGVEEIFLRAREHLTAIAQRRPREARQAPRRPQLAFEVARIRAEAQPLVPDVVRCGEDLVEDRTVGRHEVHYVPAFARLRPRPGRAFVMTPLSSTTSPFTTTCEMPVGESDALSGVPRS